MRAGRRRVHVGQLDGGRGGRGVRHGRTVVTGILLAAVAVVRTRIGLVAVTAAAVAASTAASAASTAGRRRVYVRAAVRAVGRVWRRRARPVAAAPRRHAAALAAPVVVCGHNTQYRLDGGKTKRMPSYFRTAFSTRLSARVLRCIAKIKNNLIDRRTPTAGISTFANDN